MDKCVFCKIAKKEISSNIVHEDDNSLAFLDVKPHAKGHTVIIPKQHAVTIFDVEDESYINLMKTVKKTMSILKDKLHTDGFNVGWNHNTAGGQVVPHLHIHIFPRYNGDGGGSMHTIINNPQVSVEQVAELFK
jgi:histidine triad (HIT) family protein